MKSDKLLSKDFLSVYVFVSNIRKGKYRPATPALYVCHAQGTTPPPPDSETGWTVDLWSKTNLLKWQN